MMECYVVRGGRQVRVGTKVELWEGGRPVGWGVVAKLLPERQVMISRHDEDETYRCDVEAGGGAIYVDDWTPQAHTLMAERKRRDTQPAAEFYDVEGVGQVRVGTKLEAWDGTEDDKDQDWGEVTMLLVGRRVAVYWYGAEETFISDIEECYDLFVDDWSPGVYDYLRERAKGEGGDHGQA